MRGNVSAQYEHTMIITKAHPSSSRSRVHEQAEKRPSLDDAPPGLYFTVVNNKVIQNPHKNRSGLFVEEAGSTDLFIEGLHVDHFFLNEHKTPPSLGTFAFALCAITALGECGDGEAVRSPCRGSSGALCRAVGRAA